MLTSAAAQSYSGLSHSQAQARAAACTTSNSDEEDAPGASHMAVLSPTAPSTWKGALFPLRPVVSPDAATVGLLTIITFSADSLEAF